MPLKYVVLMTSIDIKPVRYTVDFVRVVKYFTALHSVKNKGIP